RREEPGPLFGFVTRQCWQTDQGVMAHRFHMVEQVELSGRLSGVRVPTLLLGGGRDLLVSAKGLEEMANELPAGQAKSLPGCGHLAFVTHPDKVAAEARPFLMN